RVSRTTYPSSPPPSRSAATQDGVPSDGMFHSANRPARQSAEPPLAVKYSATPAIIPAQSVAAAPSVGDGCGVRGGGEADGLGASVAAEVGESLGAPASPCPPQASIIAVMPRSRQATPARIGGVHSKNEQSCNADA